MKWFTIVMVTGIGIGGLMVAWPKHTRIETLKREDAELSRRIELKRAEISRLESFRSRFNSDNDFVEHVARQNRRVYPGELVFVFED